MSNAKRKPLHKRLAGLGRHRVIALLKMHFRGECEEVVRSIDQNVEDLWAFLDSRSISECLEQHMHGYRVAFRMERCPERGKDRAMKDAVMCNNPLVEMLRKG